MVLYLKPEGRGAFGNGGNLLGWKAELCTPRPAHPVVPLSHGQDNIVLTRMTYFLFYPVLLYESACCSGVFICSSVLFCLCLCRMSMLNLWGRKWEWSFRSHATPSLNFVVVAPYIDIDVPNLLIKHLKKK